MKKFALTFAASLLLVACGKTTSSTAKVPMYGSHFAEDNWLPAEGISTRGAVQRTRGRASNRSQTVFDQPFDFSGTNAGAACTLYSTQSVVQVGQTVTLTLTMPTASTYLAQFASTNGSYQLTGISNNGTGVYTLTGYFNTAGFIQINVAAQNVPYTSQATCFDDFQVNGSYNSSNSVWHFWSNWFSPPYYRYWPNAVPYYGGGYYQPSNTTINGNNNTVNNTVNNTTNNTVVYNNPTPTPTPVPQPAAPSPVPLYRSHIALAQANGTIYEDYLYSQNQAEGAGVYTLEGPAFLVMPYPYGSFTVALNRCLVNGATSLPYHFLSTTTNCEGQRVEGAIGWVAAGQVSGTSQLYRLFKGNTGAHLTTKSQTEAAYAVSLGYTLEGPQGFAY